MTAMPPVVSREEWQAQRDELLVAEKEITRLHDHVAAKRRRLPMVRFDDHHELQTADGPKRLREFFGDNQQLAVYQFMDNGPDHFCPGCTFFTDNVTGLDGLARDGLSWITVSDMPLAQMDAYWATRGWDVPHASSHGTTFAADCGVRGGFMLTLFFTDGTDVFLTYQTTQRGVDHLLFGNSMLDLAVWGRQQDFEDSPDGWPQHPTYG